MATDVTDVSSTARATAGLEAARDRARQVGGAFDRRQRTLMAVVFAGTIGAVLAFSFLSSRTDWAPLMTDLTAADAEAVTQQLESSGTEFRLANGGSTIEVPADVVYQTRIDIASVDMPSSGKVGYGILDNQDLTSSEFSQRIGFQRAMEGELGKTIESIDGVNAATVHLALPKSDTFALDDQKATASVMVRTAKGDTLSGRQVQAIVNLVSGAVEGLAPKDVTVADGEGRVLAAPGSSPGSASGDNDELQASFENNMSSSIEDMLAAVVGPGNAKVTVAADLDFDATSSVSETYTAPTTIVPNQALAVNEVVKTETYNGDGTGAADQGILGPDGVAGTADDTAAGGNGYSLNERQVNNAVNKVVENTNRAPGAVERLSVAVIVNEEAVDATQLPELETLIGAAAGISADRGDTVAVSRFPLDTTEQDQIAEELAFREKQAKAEAAAAGVPMWALGAGGVMLLVIVVMALRSRKKRKAAMTPEVLELGSGDSIADRIITVEAHPRPAVADLTPSGLGAAAEAPNHRGERREALGDLIDNQPDEVAQLLRSWLGDRREVAR